MTLTFDEARKLDEDGYVILERAIALDLLEALDQRLEQLFADEGDQAGAEFKQEAGCRRLANLADKGEVFHRAIVFPKLLESVRQVLGAEFKLSSCNARSVNAHCDIVQPLHTDMGALPDDKGYWVCNSVWLMDDFTPQNGSLRLIPGSHRWGKLPQDLLDNLTAPHPEEILLTAPRGSIIVMNAHLWHGGTANQTDASRTALHIFFVRRDKPQQQHQKKMLRPEVRHNLSEKLRWILALDDPLNDRLSAQDPFRSGFLK